MLKPRRTLREQLEATQRSLDHYAALSGRPRVMVDVPPPPRKRAPRQPSTEPTEAQILRAVMHLLMHHPRVAAAWRQNSGTFEGRNADGTTRYVRANTARGMSDIAGTLRDGRALFIEVKSRRGRVQAHQQAFLDKMASSGALAGVVRSVEDAARLLEAS